MMGKYAKVFLFLLLLSSASSYSGEIKQVRSLGFDGVNVEREARPGSFACQVTRLHPGSLASQLGVQEGFVIFYFPLVGQLHWGCDDIDDGSKEWKDHGDSKQMHIQVLDVQGNFRNIPITTAQIQLAQKNVSKVPPPTATIVPIVQNSSAQKSMAIAATSANSPPTLTIFVDGISLYSSINSMVGRELFIGPDVDRASNYLKGSPLANIFSDGEVKEVLWNGDISDNVNVKKAVNDLEFILLKSSHECGKKINVVAHSMGTVISYLALLDLKFKTKEHNRCTYHGIDNLITLASPLVRWPSVVNRKLSELGYPSSELKIRPPGDLHIQRWINAYAQGDNVGGSIDVAGINNLPEIKTVVRSITANSTPSTAIGSIKAHSLPYTDQDTITRISNLLSNSNTIQTEPQLSVRQSAIDTTTAPVNALRLVGLEGADVTDKKGVTACKVLQVYPGTPAANAGIKADDVIVRFDGKSLNGCDDLKRIVSATQAGKTVPVEVIDLQKRVRQTIQVALTPSAQVSSPKVQLSEGALQGAETTNILLEKIERRLKALPQPPEYLYETNSFLGSVSSTTSEIFSIVSPSRKQMRQMYDELFLSATEYLGIAQLELIYARRLAKQGRTAQAEKHIKGAEHYLKLHDYSSQGAIEAYRGNIDAMHAVVEPIYEASKFAAKCLGTATHNPAISRTVNTVFYFTDYWVEASDKGLGEANINLVAQLTTAWMVKTLPIGAPVPGNWKDQTLQVATEDAVKMAFNKVFTTPELRAGLENELTTGASCLLLSKEKSFLKKAEIKPALSALASAVDATLKSGNSRQVSAPTNVALESIVINGDCPFEGCKYGERWMAKRDVDVYFAPPNAVGVPVTSLQKKAVIHKGGWVKTETGIVLSTRGEGRVDLKNDRYPTRLHNDNGSPSTVNNPPLKDGEVISIYGSGSEGCFRTFFTGKRFVVCDLGEGKFINPKYEWWIQIKTADGYKAWTNSANQPFVSEEELNSELAQKIADLELPLTSKLAQVDAFLKIGGNLNGFGGQYGTDPIEAAISTNDINILKALMSRGLNIRNKQPCTAYNAAQNALKPGGDLMLKFLLGNGMPFDCLQEPPLHAFLRSGIAANNYPVEQAIRVAEVLVRNGANVNQRNSQGQSIFDVLDHDVPANATARIRPLREALTRYARGAVFH